MTTPDQTPRRKARRFCCAALQSSAYSADRQRMRDELTAVLTDTLSTHPEPSANAARIVSDVLSGNDDGGGGATPSAAPAAQRDTKGTVYSVALHENPPRITARGTWAKRRGPLNLDALDSKCDTAGQIPADAAPPVDVRAAAENWCERVFVFASAALGDEWEPNDRERKDLIGSTERFMRAKNMTMDLPPGLALVSAVALYALPRALLPSTRERVAGIASMFRGGADDAVDVDTAQARAAA